MSAYSPILSYKEQERLEAERGQLVAQKAEIAARIAEIDRAVRASREAEFEVLGEDATATCLCHRRLVRWMAAPTWWYHDVPGDPRPAESRQCLSLWDAKAPIVITRRLAGEIGS